MRRTVLAALLVVGALLAGTAPAVAVDGPEDITVTVPERDGSIRLSNAQLRWSMNDETGAGAFAGGCNFLSAGKAGDAGRAVAWTDPTGLFRTEQGSVRVEKPNASGEWLPMAWKDRCLDAKGAQVSAMTVSSTTGAQVVIDDGAGTRFADGSLEIAWTGSFTIAFYGGMTYWSVTDPKLTLDARGNGLLVGEASGYGASMADASKWEKLVPRTITLASIRGADTSSGTGFVVTPQYLGVSVGVSEQVPLSDANRAYWGSFPESFIGFQRLTGQLAYWLTSGGVRDRAKPASPVYVNYDANAPAVVPPVPSGTGTGGGGTAQNPVVQRPAATKPAAGAATPTAPAAQASPAPDDLAALASAPHEVLPQSPSLVPLAGTGIHPALLPLTAALLAVLVGTLAAFGMLKMLPWQRRARKEAQA